jgi:hypothetical protein
MSILKVKCESWKHLDIHLDDVIQLQWNLVVTNSVVKEHSVITNRFFGQSGHFSTQNNLVRMNPGYNEQKWPVPNCSL